MLNSEIHKALELACNNKNIGPNTQEQIKVYLNTLAAGSVKQSDLDIMINNVLKAITNGT